MHSFKINKPKPSGRIEKGRNMVCSTRTSERDFSNQLSREKTPAFSNVELDLALRRHYDDFRKYLFSRVGDPAIAEDILHSFCIRVMQNGTELRNPKSAMGWLYTVLRSVLMDYYRKESSRKRGEYGYAADVAVMSEDTANSEPDEVICGCVNGLATELRADQADILRRIDFNEEPRERVSRDLGISHQNLRVRLHRARAALKNALLRHCGACCETGFRDCYCDKGCTQPV